MGVINSPLVEGGVFSEEVNKKEVTVNGANSNAISSGFYYFLHGYDLNIHFFQNDCLYNC